MKIRRWIIVVAALTLQRRILGQRRRAALQLDNRRRGVPARLTINASTGQITGTPTQSGSFSFRARVTDSDETQLFRDSVQSITISS